MKVGIISVISIAIRLVIYIRRYYQILWYESWFLASKGRMWHWNKTDLLYTCIWHAAGCENMTTDCDNMAIYCKKYGYWL